MKQELVSVIMPTYNAGKYLSSSIDSVLNQTYQNIELLITDDYSTDKETHDILNQYRERDPRVKIEMLRENRGTGFSRNNAIERAQGRYIAFCDCDDRWMPDKLEKQIQFIENRDCALCCTSYLICNEDDDLIGINHTPAKITFQMERLDNKIGCLTAIYDTKRLGRKYLMPKIRKRQDWGMFLQILSQCHYCLSIEEPLAIYRKREGSISNRKFSLIKYNIQIYHDILGYGWIKSFFYFFCLFLPNYGLKVCKRKFDSFLFRQRLKHSKTQS